MTNEQRMKNDIETSNKRDMVDKTIRDNRSKNDELTDERRFKADETMNKNRLRNDEMTANRRDVRDGNMGTVLAVSLLVLLALAVGIFFIW